MWNAEAGSLDAESLREAVERLREGRVLAVPTETVYGLATDADNHTALQRLAELKGRSANSAFPLQVSDFTAVTKLAGDQNPAVHRLFCRFTPGPITLVIPCARSLDPLVQSEQGAVGVRIPDHPVMQMLLRMLDAPLAVTSANLSGQPPAQTFDELLQQVGHGIDGGIDAGPSRLGKASTVVDCCGTEPRLLREGAVPLEAILRVWREEETD